jgi:hypothetical protein
MLLVVPVCRLNAVVSAVGDPNCLVCCWCLCRVAVQRACRPKIAAMADVIAILVEERAAMQEHGAVMMTK